MKVIKAVKSEAGKLTSSFASGEWKREYVPGVETKPDIGYLFAYRLKSGEEAMGEIPRGELWLAEAEVMGSISLSSLNMHSRTWQSFWAGLKLRKSKDKRYLLCSSITLLKPLKEKQ